MSIRNDIKDGLKITWYFLQLCALTITSICIIWTITQFMPSDWSGRCAVGIVSLVSLIYMIKLLMQATDVQKTMMILRKWSKMSKNEIEENKGEK